MLNHIIIACAKRPWLTVIATCFISLLAIFSLRFLRLDAIPELSDTQVIVAADWPGRSAEIIENQVTYPLTTGLLSVPRVKYVRGVSMNGASQVTLVFDEGTDLYWARSRITEKLGAIRQLPAEVTPSLGPEATGLGWVFQYALIDRSGQNDLADLRSWQDFHLRYDLQSIQGVAEVASVGGFVKQYQVHLDPIRLQAYHLSPLHVIRALREANSEIGAHVVELGETEFSIRSQSYLKSVAEMRRVPVQVSTAGEVVTIGELGDVRAAPAPRYGFAELDGEGETVSGIVVMRQGENALQVVERVKEKIKTLSSTLPKGMEIVPAYDRSTLIERALATLRAVLIEELLIVALVVSIFLWHARASLVALIPLPIAVLLSFLPMAFSSLTLNIMSLGGIALAIGAMVDSGIILLENAAKKFEGSDTRTLPEEKRQKMIIAAMQEVGKPLFFSLLVITVSFLPIFALEGREGKLFKPLAFTKTVSMGWAAVLAVTLIPALSILFLRGRFLSEEKHPVSRFMHRLYGPAVDFSVQHRKVVVLLALLLMLATLPIIKFLPSEFMPPLNEGSILYMPTSVPGMSIDTAITTMQRQNQLIKELPEVERVLGKGGRANSATDPAPINMFETVIMLKPKEAWRDGMTHEKIVAELDRKLMLAGMPNIWWMPIQTRLEMLTTGIRSVIGIKVYGSKLSDVEQTALQMEAVLRDVSGTRTAFAERGQTGPFIDITLDRDRLSRYGLSIRTVQTTIESALGGSLATSVLEGRERYDVVVRYAKDFRENLDAIARMHIQLPNGAHIPLQQVAQITTALGPAMITSENGKFLSFVYIDPKSEVDLDRYVYDATTAINKNVILPEGVSFSFSGQFEAWQSAKSKLVWIIPLTLCVIFALIYLNTRSLVETAIVLLAVPFSLVGAFVLLWILGYKMSVATWVGILALAGLDAETGVVMLLYLTRSYQDRIALLKGKPMTWQILKDVIHEGAVLRVRPKIMTVLAAMLGLLPIMWSTGTGAELMKRVAAPMVGGVVTSGILELLIYPALFAIWKEREISKSMQP